MDERLLRMMAMMSAHIELLEHVVVRLINHDRSGRFDELEFFVRERQCYTDYGNVPTRAEEILDRWKQDIKAGGDDGKT